MKNKKLVTSLIISDILSSCLAWVLFFILRKLWIEPLKFGYKIPIVLDLNFVFGMCLVPVFWFALYYFSGFYRNPYRKNQESVFTHTFFSSLLGVIILFFTLILNDVVANYKDYYLSFLILFSLQFFITYIPRYIIVQIVLNKIARKAIYFNTLIIGSGKQACEIYNELESQERSLGNKFIGFIALNNHERYLLSLPELGRVKDLPQIIKENKIEEVIIAMGPEHTGEIFEIIDLLGRVEVKVKAIPDLHTVLKGSVGMSNIFGTPLIEIKHEPMSVLHQQVKQFIDITVSFAAILILSPVFVFCALGVKLTSKGPVFIRQERIGRYGRSFILYKFRSMYIDAEKNGPNLATKNDCRVTSFGKFLRRTKLDEIPNFWNVLKGDMSLVGPRPERKFYIDQIVQIAPDYLQLQKIKPGITSLGQVKFGYAENVEQMTKRLRYDILYMENMSLYIDFQILFYTVVLLFRGRHI